MDGSRVVAAEPAEVLGTLRRCAAVGPFFAVGLHRPGDAETGEAGGAGEPRWQPGTALLAPTDELSAAIEAVRRWASDTTPRVAASLFFMSYTGRLLSPAVAGVLVDGVLLDLRAHRLLWRYRPGDGLQLRMRAVPPPAGWRPAPGQLRDVLLSVLGGELVDGQLAATVRAIRELVPVSARVLWGNVASSLVGALGAVAATGAVPAMDCRRAADALLDLPRLRGTGHLRQPPGDRRQLEFRRRSCCLYYRLPGAGKCADCVLLPDPAGRRALPPTPPPHSAG